MITRDTLLYHTNPLYRKYLISYRNKTIQPLIILSMEEPVLKDFNNFSATTIQKVFRSYISRRKYGISFDYKLYNEYITIFFFGLFQNYTNNNIGDVNNYNEYNHNPIHFKDKLFHTQTYNSCLKLASKDRIQLNIDRYRNKQLVKLSTIFLRPLISTLVWNLLRRIIISKKAIKNTSLLDIYNEFIDTVENIENIKSKRNIWLSYFSEDYTKEEGSLEIFKDIYPELMEIVVDFL